VNVAPKPRPVPPPNPKRAGKMPSVGWLELIVVSQTVLPALMFVPSLVPYRTISRMIAYLLPLAAWAAHVVSGRRVAGGRAYPPAICLGLAVAWMTISIGNPMVNTLASALCAVMITTAVLCPAFWAPAAITDPRQLKRLLMILLVCNGASALMGLAQVYRPDTFRPPRILVFEVNGEAEGMATIVTDDGRKILRPPGLTDSPGGAAIGGLISCAIGLAVALTPIAWWKRSAGMGIAVVGLTVLFYSQIRSMTITLILGLVLWGVLLALRGEAKKLATLGVLGAVLALAAVGWVVRGGGARAMDRFLSLFEERATTVFYRNRGAFIEHSLTEQLPRFPLGAGPGRIGMASFYFGNPLTPRDRAPLYGETQIDYWVINGGLPLVLLYPVALILAFIIVIRTAVWSPDPEVAYWAGAVFVYAVAAGASLMAGPAFEGPPGVQFWVLLGALYGTAQQARVDALKAKARIARL
jgi:hypothetical protein